MMVVALVLGIAGGAGRGRSATPAKRRGSPSDTRARRILQRGWGPFFDRCPQKKFWLGMIPLYGWPGYLQILSAIDAYHGRTSDNLRPVSGGEAHAPARHGHH